MTPLPNPNFPWPILMEGVALVAEAEDLRLVAYQCQADVWTIGWGETEPPGAGRPVQPGDTCTKEQADQWLCAGLKERADLVREACTVPPSQHELAAMTSLAYNYGGWKKSSVLRAHNAGDKLAAARAFGLVNKFTDPKTHELVVSRGLTARRARESAFYLTPDGNVPRLSVQAVEAESTLVKSPISQAGTVTVLGGVLTTVTQYSDQVKNVAKDVSEFAVSMHINPGLVLGLMLIGAGLVSVYWRWKQRRGGWA